MLIKLFHNRKFNSIKNLCEEAALIFCKGINEKQINQIEHFNFIRANIVRFKFTRLRN